MPTGKEIVEGLLSELRRGTLVLSVLSQLDKPQYGYSLVQLLSEKGVPIEANTLYPLLRRLEGQELLKSMWETDGAKPRKYYVLTEKGSDVFTQLREEWTKTVQGITALMEE